MLVLSVMTVKHLSKQYDLGIISISMLASDLNRLWERVRGWPDPEAVIGREVPDGSRSGSILAPDDVGFSVQQGEALGIIGRNGADKSTLLKILSLVTAPSSGRVRIKGRIGSLLEVGLHIF
jgi:lipopolysaccharide transport system ATP-binding protein